MFTMNRKKILLTVLAVLCAVVITACGSGSSKKQEEHSPVSVRLIHTNDHHSYLDSGAYDLKLDNITTRVQLGGFARLATVIKAKRNANSIVVNSGELAGTLYFSLFHGEVDFKVFNELGLDGYTLGNHEFDDGDERLAELIEMTDFPILSSNMHPEAASPLYRVKDRIKPYVIKEIGGEKIGIIGILKVEKTKNSSMASDNITFDDEIESAKANVAELQSKGVNKIILVSHVGYYNDILFAKNVPGIDIIVGGDTHDLLGDADDLAEIGLAPSFGSQTGPFDGYTHDGFENEDLGAYPTTVIGADGKPVHIVTAWCYAYGVGVLDIDFNKDGVVTKVNGNIILPVGDVFQRANGSGTFEQVTAEVKTQILAAIERSPILTVAAVDQTIDDIIEPYRAQKDASLNEVIGTVTVTMDNTRIPTAFTASQTPTGSYAAWVVAEAFKNTNHKIDVAIQNAGGVRTPLMAGQITAGDAIAVLPFSNTVVMLDMKGSDIVQVLNEAAWYSIHSGSSGAFPYSSGLRYDVNLSGDNVSIITNVEVQDRDTGVWSNISANTVYTVATNSFTALGKDNYLSFARVREEDPTIFEDTSILYSVPLVDYLKSLPAQTLPPLDVSLYCLKSVTN
ncbi:5'-nucleotidase C-terminal domain-containing protein [Geovibrio ferrireducens]|uniref:5'-nucleotidase C-terminal domain-containing protein n=1 Tax=Geovibrio ferrireducens TaxID=46201 RepID=UPI0022464DE8|nr:5'-nucleotidase C-terminal domain-containing protein [Geovibrio ferrireducens]